MGYFEKKPYRRKSVIVDTLPKFHDFAHKLMAIKEVSIDTETNTLKVRGPNKDFECYCMQFSWGDYDNYMLPLGFKHSDDFERNIDISYVVPALNDVFAREDLTVIGHNLIYDLHVLKRLGIDVISKDLVDTMVWGFLIDENIEKSLKKRAQYEMGVERVEFKENIRNLIPVEVRKEFGCKGNQIPPFGLLRIDDAVEYALNDAFDTWKLYCGYREQLYDEGMDKIYYKMYQPYLRLLFDMEERGVTVDIHKLKKFQAGVKKDKEELTGKIYDVVGVEFNIGSNQQLAEVLFGYEKKGQVSKKTGKKGNVTVNQYLIDVNFGFKPVSLTAGGMPQTNSLCMIKLLRGVAQSERQKEGQKFCEYLLEYKRLDKLDNAFISGLEDFIYDDGKVHTSLNIVGTDSGRLSASSPNMQQLPRVVKDESYQIRDLFIGDIDEKGVRKKIISADFSNLELKLLAHWSTDKYLLELFKEGYDVHGYTAVKMFELDCEANKAKELYPQLRQAAKVLNFGLMYGMGAPTLYETLKNNPDDPIDLGDKTYLELYGVSAGNEVAQIYVDKYFKEFEGVAKFIRGQKKFAHKYGYVQTLMRRKRRLPFIQGKDYKMVSYAERLAVNATIQGSAADVTINAQLRINADPWFAEHSCYQLLQIHDELVLECPGEYVEEAKARIIKIMSHPFGEKKELNLALTADAGHGDTYAEAK